MIVGDLVRLRAKPVAGDDDLPVEIDTFDLADVQLHSRTDVPNGCDRMENPNAARDHFCKHRLRDKVILLIDEGECEFGVVSQSSAESQGRVDASESSSQYEDSLAGTPC